MKYDAATQRHIEKMAENSRKLDLLPYGTYRDNNYRWEKDEEGWTPIHAPGGMPSEPMYDELKKVTEVYTPISELEKPQGSYFFIPDIMGVPEDLNRLREGSKEIPDPQILVAERDKAMSDAAYYQNERDALLKGIRRAHKREDKAKAQRDEARRVIDKAREWSARQPRMTELDRILL